VGTWAGVVDHFGVGEEAPGQIDVSFTTNEGRSQLVQVFRREVPPFGEWAAVVSAFSQARPDTVANSVASLFDITPIGGVVQMGEYLFIRHVLPLEDVTSNQLEWAVRLVAVGADELERKLTGQDQY
jgi:hypothetical protein